MVDGKKILVTGSGGFIGSHLVEALVSRGADVTCILRYGSAGSRGNLEFTPKSTLSRLRLLFGNVEDSDFLMRSLDGQEIAIHLAALIAIPYSYIAPRSYFRTNIEGTLNLLEAARRAGLERIVHTSTSEVYGTAQFVPISEEHPLQGQSPYSASKIGADKLVESYYRSFDLPVVTVRPFNTFGPRQSQRAVIPTIILQALERDHIELGELSAQRDMTFVTDTCDGLVRAATASNVVGETINLGTGQTSTVQDLAQRVLRLLGMDKAIRFDQQRIRPAKSEVLRLVSDNSRARRLLNWHPRVPLDEGLSRTIEFMDKHRHLYRSESYTV